MWYQPEEVFPATESGGAPEARAHAFWAPVDARYYELSRELEEGRLLLERCAGNGTTTCLPRRPVVARVERGCSASVFVDNAAYREFLRSRFGVTAVDMETAAVALVALQQGRPSSPSGRSPTSPAAERRSPTRRGRSAPLAARNAAAAAVELISLIP